MPTDEERDRNSLKEQALLERLSQIVAQYENQIAELRVELTLMAKRLKGEDAPQEAEETKPAK
jgi:uncharacterized coiled-coil protein SlyX